MMRVAAAVTDQTYLDLAGFTTGAGELLPEARLAYRVTGNPDTARANGWIVVFHALTGSADVAAWWGPLIGPGRPLDTDRHAVVSANLLGSCYGSSGPREWQRLGRDGLPLVTTRDLARAFEALVSALGIEHVALATGGSLGGMVALQWGAMTAAAVDHLAVFAAPAVTSPQAIAWNAAQRMAIEADPAWQGGRYFPGPGPWAGLAAARAIAMITYRSASEFVARFGREQHTTPGRFDVESYLRRQGDKLVARFDAASYVTLMAAMDAHDVGPLDEAARQTARRVARVTGIGIDTDILYPAAEVRAWVDAYRPHIDARYEGITSLSGHDAFLIEFDQVEAILKSDR
jgi:homoserine O-acetyltransferase